jgi:hypothetical protein
LAIGFGKVYYFQPWEEGFSKIHTACTGDGYGDIVRADKVWSLRNEVDVWVFPDIGHSDLQLELERQDKAVWGSRKGDELELNRELFLKTLAEVGLDVPTFEVVVGITNLRAYLKEQENRYIKISRYRGMMETTHWRSWKEDHGLLDQWAVKWGPMGEYVRFLVFEPIETDLEIGCDTYNVLGQFPNVMLHGIEQKDKAYLAAVTKREDMPKQLQDVLSAFGPVLGRYGYRNEFSIEVRVDGDRSYFIDPTCRGGLPSTASQIALWINFPEIVWWGAQGELCPPVPRGTFSAEAVLSVKAPRKTWVVADIPSELKDHVKLAGCCCIDGADWFPPSDDEGHEIGWLVAYGNSPKEAVDKLLGVAKQLPDGVSAATESLADVIKEIDSEQAQGIPFSKEPLPEPAVVLDD